MEAMDLESARCAPLLTSAFQAHCELRMREAAALGPAGEETAAELQLLTEWTRAAREAQADRDDAARRRRAMEANGGVLPTEASAEGDHPSPGGGGKSGVSFPTPVRAVNRRMEALMAAAANGVDALRAEIVEMARVGETDDALLAVLDGNAAGAEEAEKAAAALAEAKKKHAAELARLKADQAAAIAKASDKRAKELAAEHERKLEEMRQVHAADVEKRGGALKTTRVQLQETSAQVAKLRELHEKSAAEARTADAASRRADDRARVAREAREATLRALQDAVSLAVASGAAEADIRKSMRKHGVVLLNENGELRVAEGDAGDGGSSVSVSDHGVAVSPASTKSAAEVSKTVEGEMDAIAQKYIAGEMGGKKKTGGIFGFGSKKK